MRRSLLTLLFLATCAVAAAQSVQWQRTVAGADMLDLVFADCNPAPGGPQLPVVAGITFTRLNEVTSFSSINGVASRSFTVTYRLRASAGTQVQIPAFTVQTDRGPITVPEFRGNLTNSPAENLARAVFTTPASSYWAGEVFPLTYTVSTPRRLGFSQIAGDIEWIASPLITESWSNPEGEDTTINGERQISVIYKTQAYAKTPGRAVLESAHQLLNIQAGTGPFGFPAVRQISVTSNRPEITIRPLPSGAPATFLGAVGTFAIKSSIVPAAVTVGEPVTWSLTLSGSGNWPDIAGLPVRTVSRDFQAVQPKAKKTPVEGKLFEAGLSEDVVLVPTRPGTYKLGPVTYTYFNPADGKYHTIKTDEATVEVTDPTGTALKAQPPAPPPAVRPIGASGKMPDPAPLPDAIPRDPLPGTGRTLVPMSARTFYVVLGAGPAALLLAWLALAWRHAVLTDPLRPQRLAIRRMYAAIAALRGSGSAAKARPAVLLEWQRSAAQLWGVHHAAPPSSAMTDAAWTGLWNEADRAMYSATGQLPADWTERAHKALAAKRLKPLNPFKLLLPRHLFPFLALALAIAATPRAHGADASAEYQKGNFAVAERQWRAAVRTNPRDWVSRHNLSLALAQGDKWAEAAAHASVAFVQSPRNPSVRWHLDPMLVRGAIAPAPLVPFVQHQWRQEVARLASPGEWQLILALATALASLGLGLGLMRAYGWRSPWISRCALLCTIVGVIAGAGGVVGLRAFGPAADSRAVLAFRAGTLRSIPTEADTAQKTTPLAAGSIAVVDRSFLGWRHLTFPNGQTGWVRNDEILGFWR